MIKAFVTDLDGSLLNRWHKSDKFIDDVVKKAVESGYIFVVATGRHLHSTHQIGLNFLGEKIYKIAMNGALIRSTDDTVLRTFPLDSSIVEKLKNTFPGVSFEFITEKGVYINRGKWQHFVASNKGNRKFKYWFKALLLLLKGDVKPIEACDEAVLKIDCFVPNKNLASQVKKFVEEHDDYLVDAGPNGHHFEITASGVNKKVATDWLMHRLGIEADAVATYGNDLNDLELIRDFQQSYVPNNAKESIKKVAKHIVDSNENHGVAKQMLDIIVQQEDRTA